MAKLANSKFIGVPSQPLDLLHGQGNSEVLGVISTVKARLVDFRDSQISRISDLPQVSFSEARGFLEDCRPDKIGKTYCLSSSPSKNDLRSISGLDGEIECFQVKGKDIWLFNIHMVGNISAEEYFQSLVSTRDLDGQKGFLKAQEEGLGSAFRDHDLISTHFHNHPKGKPPLSSLADHRLATCNEAKMAISLPEGVLFYSSDGLKHPSEDTLFWNFESSEWDYYMVLSGMRKQTDEEVTIVKKRLNLTSSLKRWDALQVGDYRPNERFKVDLIVDPIPQKKLQGLFFLYHMLYSQKPKNSIVTKDEVSTVVDFLLKDSDSRVKSCAIEAKRYVSYVKS